MTRLETGLWIFLCCAVALLISLAATTTKDRADRVIPVGRQLPGPTIGPGSDTTCFEAIGGGVVCCRGDRCEFREP